MILDFDAQADTIYPAWCTAVGELSQQLPTVKTGKGYHVRFRCAEPGPNRNLAVSATGEILIQTRGERGYALAPPSIHPSGTPYELLHGDLADIPCLDADTYAYVMAVTQGFDERSEPLNSLSAVDVSERECRYVKAAFEGELRKVAQAPDGTKHDRLRDSVIAVAGFIPSGYITADEIRNAFYTLIAPRAANKSNARRTIEDAIRYGSARPRALPANNRVYLD